MGYARTPFRDFESYLEIVLGLEEDDTQLILEQYRATFITDEVNAGNYTIKGISEAVYTKGDHERTFTNPIRCYYQYNKTYFNMIWRKFRNAKI